MWMFSREPGTERPGEILREKLLQSSTTFIEVYSKDVFIKTSEKLAQLCSQVQGKAKHGKKDNTARALLGGFCGASLGGTFGAFSGGVCGALGAVAAAAVYSEELNAVNATVGFFGGITGGMVGAIFSGLLGGALGAAAEAANYPFDKDVYNIAWGCIGAATGAGLGHIFGGTVGAVGGGFGGGMGGLIGVHVGVCFVQNVLGIVKATRQLQDPEQHPKVAQEVATIKEIEQTFRENASAVVGELFIINSISSKMSTKAGAHSVAAQSSKSLATVARMEKALGDAQKAESMAKITSCLEQAAEQCKQADEEFGKMKTDAEKLLASWSKCFQ